MNLKVCGGSGQIIFIPIQRVYLNWDKSIQILRSLIIYVCNIVQCKEDKIIRNIQNLGNKQT